MGSRKFRVVLEGMVREVVEPSLPNVRMMNVYGAEYFMTPCSWTVSDVTRHQLYPVEKMDPWSKNNFK